MGYIIFHSFISVLFFVLGLIKVILIEDEVKTIEVGTEGGHHILQDAS